MVPVLVILTIVVFVVVDLILRAVLTHRQEARARRERQKALDIGLRLEFAEEAPSLKRVEVEHPKARILAVDDEPVVLDSFRKILVLDGYSVATVETGPEALGLVRKADYDFVFTDLKMPGMDGLDVTKAVKHLRPDVDVVMITGYATIESAVDAMKFGAMDYVQKPFTPDELIDFAKTLLIRRQDRIERQRPPEVHLVTPSSTESPSPRAINVPGGVFVSPEHAWVSIEITGEARVGLDDFAHKTLGILDGIAFPNRGARVSKGNPLFSVKRGDRSLTVPSPLSGRISRINHELIYELDVLQHRPYDLGWICRVEPTNVTEELKSLRIGADAIPWYASEVRRFSDEVERIAAEAGAPPGGEGKAPVDDARRRWEHAWTAFAACCGPAATS